VDQRVGHLAGADPLEVEPRDQLLDRRRLPQVRREDLAREAEADAVVADAAVVDARLAHLDRPQARQDRPRRLVAVADDQPMAGAVALVPGAVHVLGHLVLDRLLQRPPGALAGDLLQGGTDDRLGCQPQGKLG